MNQLFLLENRFDVFFETKLVILLGLPCVEFVFAPQHETSCDPETTTKEDFDYRRKITEKSNLELYRRIHDKPNEAEN